MKRITLSILVLASLSLYSQTSKDSLYQLAITDLSAFAKSITEAEDSDFEKTKSVVNWYARNFDWTYTDYQKRTVQDILERRGGNCYELAMATQATLEALGVKMRRMREVNLHKKNTQRQQDAEEMVAKNGRRASVFGLQHNDHVWLEVYDAESDTWQPADPSLGVVGQRRWLAARYGFTKRYSLDPNAGDMIAPFAIFVEQENGLWGDRTAHYAIEGFNQLYYGQLEKLPSWEAWKEQVDQLSGLAYAAFNKQINLHKSNEAIAKLKQTYDQLKLEFLATDLGTIHQNIDAFSKSLVGGDFEAVVNAYTKDAAIFPQRGDIRRGQEAIRTYWTPPAGRKSRTVHHRILPVEIVVSGEEAYDWGYYEGATERANGEKIHWEGKYVIVWKKTADGEWKIYLDSWNNL